MKVLLGVSGGVDSSVSAYLLKKQGYEVLGIYLKMHKGIDHKSNLEKVDYVSKKIGFDYVVEDIQETFEKEVYEYFIESYKAGKTPNPCAMCNKTIKFGVFMKFLEKYNADKAATGHYVKSDGEFLYKAKDKNKDQSYFLFGVDKNIIKDFIFPLGDLYKTEVKEIASKIGLENLAKSKESQDVCFIENSYIDVLKLHFNPEKKGTIINKRGQKIGIHKGYSFYTIGQRKGFSLFKSHKPHYVISIDAKSNTLIVGDKKDLEKKVIFLKGVNLFIDKKEFNCLAKVRYRTEEKIANVKLETKSKAIVYFKDKVIGVAKGQACVFYDNDKLLGGGWIRGAK